MTEDITGEQIARAVLAALACSRHRDDPLGSLARTVLDGELDLRTAAANSWHGQALGDAFAAATARRDSLPASEREEYDRQAQELREADGSLGHDTDPDRDDQENRRP